MQKRIITTLLLPVFLLSLQTAKSQITIKGQTCVIAGSSYQYYIDNVNKWASTARMKVCVEGGIIADQEERKRKNCTDNDAPLSAIIVIWNNVSIGTITVSSSGGSKTFSVNVVPPLDPGTVSVKEQELSDATRTPSNIQCSPVKGGSCSPQYAYQWQQSLDALTWTDIGGATGQHLSFSGPQDQTTYYRRIVTERSSNTIAYSDIATVIVLQMADTSAIIVGGGTSGLNDSALNLLIEDNQSLANKITFERTIAMANRKNRINTK